MNIKKIKLGEVVYDIVDSKAIHTINGQQPDSSGNFSLDIPDISKYVTAEDAGAITDTIPETFEGHRVEEFVLKQEVVDTLNSNEINKPLSANQGRILNENQKSKLSKNGDVMQGMLVAQNNTNYTTKQVRNIFLSTVEPTKEQGESGDIWIIYNQG